MLLEAIRLALVVALLVAVPGFLLVQAAFPPARSRLLGSERAYLAITAGIMLLMLVGVVLGLLPHDDKRGYFTTFATGFPNVELAMALVSALLFFVGLQRGAYPRMAERFKAGRSPTASPSPRAGSPPP